MAKTASLPIETVRRDLARAVRSLRADCIAAETARRLLEYDQPGHTSVVGLNDAGEEAILYHQRDRYGVAVEFDPDGLADEGVVICTLRRGPSLDEWIELRDRRDYWGWIHPRYR